MSFVDWQIELMNEVYAINKVAARGGALVDAHIPYKLGWSPGRAARAILGLQGKDKDLLLDIQREQLCGSGTSPNTTPAETTTKEQ